MRPGVVDAAERAPAVGEVAAEIDPVAVATRILGDAVRVEDRDDPEVELVRRPTVCELFGDRDAGWFVAVDAADDQRPAPRVEVADFDRDNRTAVGRPAEKGHVATGRVESRAPSGCNNCRE